MSPCVIPYDFVLVACVVAGAAAFLAWRMLGRGPPPACHQTALPSSRASPEGDVVLGASLQRGLGRARARKHTTNVRALSCDTR